MKQLLCVVATAVSLFGAVSTVNAADRVPTRTEGVLTIGSDLSYPPYYSIQERTSVGFGPDLMRALSNELKLEPDFVNTRFAQLILRLKSRRLDVVASALYITPARAEQIDFIPVFQTGDVLISRTNGYQAKTLDDLCGHRVGVIQGGSVIKKLEDEAGRICPDGDSVTLRQFPTAPGATQALLARAVDAQLTDAAVGQQTVKHLGSRVAITSSELLFPIPVGLGVNKDANALRDALTTALGALKANGRYSKLLSEYGLSAPDGVLVAEALGRTIE